MWRKQADVGPGQRAVQLVHSSMELSSALGCANQGVAANECAGLAAMLRSNSHLVVVSVADAAVVAEVDSEAHQVGRRAAIHLHDMGSIALLQDPAWRLKAGPFRQCTRLWCKLP